jgi:hypothetical protein
VETLLTAALLIGAVMNLLPLRGAPSVSGL